LVCYHQSDQIVVYRCTYLLLEGGITHNIVYLYIQHKIVAYSEPKLPLNSATINHIPLLFSL
jgi:hypothetical protein